MRHRVSIRRQILFFFNDTATTEIYPLSLHDALPISAGWLCTTGRIPGLLQVGHTTWRSEEHTSELQSRLHLVCRLLLEKKIHTYFPIITIKNKQIHRIKQIQIKLP